MATRSSPRKQQQQHQQQQLEQGKWKFKSAVFSQFCIHVFLLKISIPQPDKGILKDLGK